MPELNRNFVSLLTASLTPMKFSELESAFITAGQASSTANLVLTEAQADAQVKAQAASKATTTFAAAIVAKGGEVSNTATGISYRSSDSKSVNAVRLVTMDDDVPGDPMQTPAPSDPTSTTVSQ